MQEPPHDFDGGQTWLSPRLQPSAKADVPANYWHPVPEGTTSVKVRAAPGNRGDWFAFDFRIWSSNADGALVPARPLMAVSAGTTAMLSADAPSALPATGSEPRAGSGFPWAITIALVVGGVTLLAGRAAALRRTR